MIDFNYLITRQFYSFCCLKLYKSRTDVSLNHNNYNGEHTSRTHFKRKYQITTCITKTYYLLLVI